MGMMWMMAGLIRLIKIIRLIEFIRFIKVISLIAVDANLLVGWQVGGCDRLLLRHFKRSLSMLFQCLA